MGSDGMGQGRPHSPYLYKYHPNAEEKWGGGGRKERQKTGRETEREKLTVLREKEPKQ
jgi:hypothetical protein